MLSASDSPPPDPSASGPLPTLLGGLNPDELFARGMQSVRMTGGGSLQSWEPPSVAEAARLFPTYEISELIGRGGMGAVYKGKQTALDRTVAIKLLPLEISVDRDFGDRFVREARTMAKLNHANIVSVFDFGKTSEGHLYFVMEFVEGTTLHHLIKAVGLKPLQALELIVCVCEALHYAHSEGVIHRDIKPANILVDVKGRVKVTDFGLARMSSPTAEQWGQTMTGMVLGTPDYMAPEQKKGSHVDHRADIYSLGVMLYEMLCGEVPQGIFDPPSHRVTVDERIDKVVHRAMQQEPDRRYRDTAEMRTDVENIRSTPMPKMGEPLTVARPGNGQSGGPSATPRLPLASGAPTVPPTTAAPATAQPAQHHSAPVLSYIAAGCAVIAVGVVLLKEFRAKPEPKVADATPAPVVAPPVSTPAPIAEVPPSKVETVGPAKVEPVKVETPPVLAVATPMPKPEETREPLAPVPMPPADRPVAVATVPLPPKPLQVFPPAANALPIVRPAPIVPVPAVPMTTEPAPETAGDWTSLVAEGDALVKRRRNEDAIEAYLEALDVAEANATVSGIDAARVCRSLSSLLLQTGSNAEARQTLQRGRQMLMRSKGAPERQKMLDQIDKELRNLPRE